VDPEYEASFLLELYLQCTHVALPTSHLIQVSPAFKSICAQDDAIYDAEFGFPLFIVPDDLPAVTAAIMSHNDIKIIKACIKPLNKTIPI
jgi:hypothetical protein